MTPRAGSPCQRTTLLYCSPSRLPPLLPSCPLVSVTQEFAFQPCSRQRWIKGETHTHTHTHIENHTKCATHHLYTADDREREAACGSQQARLHSSCDRQTSFVTSPSSPLSCPSSFAAAGAIKHAVRPAAPGTQRWLLVCARSTPSKHLLGLFSA